jgi:Na+/H+ antiporter NhaC
MKYSIPFIAVGFAAACNAVLAAEYGTVISSTPVTAQVAVPQQHCAAEQQLVLPLARALQRR